MSETAANTKQEPKKQDLIAIARDFLYSLKRLWWVVLILTALFGGILYYRKSVNFYPQFVLERTYAVELVNGGSYANRNTAEQMGKIFPSITTSGALSDIISDELGTSGVPGSIKVSCISGTNLLTITVSSAAPATAEKIMNSVVKNYPEVAQYVVGQTKLIDVDVNGKPVATGKTTVVRGSLRTGALIGFALGMLIVIIRSVAFRTIRSESELHSVLNLSCLGTLPACRSKDRKKSERHEINILFDSNRSSYIESMRLIRTRLERQLSGRQVLMVTSSVAGEGKSTVAANLAISMALKGKRVILVDCDLRNPTVSKIFNLKESYPGLISVIKGKSSIDDALVRIENDKLSNGITLLPGADVKSRHVELLSSEEMGHVVEALRTKADVVILDTPPSAVLVDAMMLVKYVDAIAYVIMSDYARRRSIIDGVEELSTSSAPIVGCILNAGKTHSGRYGGYYGYYGKYGRYGYGYGRYGYGRYGYGYSHYGGYGYGGYESAGNSSDSKRSKSKKKRSKGK